MKREGFTLIELLMVIVVILLMIALILPACQRSRQQAETLVCRGNLKQLVYDRTMYHDDNNGTFPNAFNTSEYTMKNPPPGGYAGDIVQDRMGWWWFNYIKTDYSTKDYEQKKVVRCPSRNVSDRRLKRNVLCGNYGVNQSICRSATGRKSRAEFIGRPLSTTDLPQSARTLLIADSGYSLINWWHVTETPPAALGSTIEDAAYIPGLKINEERTNLWPGQQADAIEGRHRNKTVNVGFADGHVRCIEADQLFVEQTGDTYEKRSPLWIPK